MKPDLERRIEAFLKQEEDARVHDDLKRMVEDINKKASKPIILPGLTIPAARR